MTGMAIPAGTVDDFASSLTGSLLGADDQGYEDARKVWNGYIDRRPALIARCANVDDVRAAVRFALKTACRWRCAAGVTQLRAGEPGMTHW